MEQGYQSDGTPTLSCCALHSGISGQDMDSVLTDAVLSELKKQSADGCLLCSLDALEGEEWD